MPWDDGLDELDWAGMAHAYGPADDVPGLLRLLASRDPEERSVADWELNGSIVHQGTLYEATAAACRFLGRLAAEVDHARWRATCDLAYIAGLAFGDAEPSPHDEAVGRACASAIPELLRAVPHDDPAQVGAVLALVAACEPLDPDGVALAVEHVEDPALAGLAALVLARSEDEAWRMADLRLQLVPAHADLGLVVRDDRAAAIRAGLPVAPTWQRRRP